MYTAEVHIEARFPLRVQEAHETGVVSPVVSLVPQDKVVCLFLRESADRRRRVEQIEHLANPPLIREGEMEFGLQVGQFARPGWIRPNCPRADAEGTELGVDVVGD